MTPAEQKIVQAEASRILDEASAKLKALGQCPAYLLVLAEPPRGYHVIANGIRHAENRAYLAAACKDIFSKMAAGCN